MLRFKVTFVMNTGLRIDGVSFYTISLKTDGALFSICLYNAPLYLPWFRLLGKDATIKCYRQSVRAFD